MKRYIFEPPEVAAVPIVGRKDLFPVRRILCVGRRYYPHKSIEDGGFEYKKPFYFFKGREALVQSGGVIPYPNKTEALEYELELTIAIGQPLFKSSPQSALEAIFGFGCGFDMTRRDLEQDAFDNGQPWDVAKNFRGGVVLGALRLADGFAQGGQRSFVVSVNGETRTKAVIKDMLHSADKILSDLSNYYHLEPGDIVMMGNPGGTEPVLPGDHLDGVVDGTEPVSVTIGPMIES